MAKIGRPPADTEPVTLRLSRDVLAALERFRREPSDKIPTRPEAIRTLLIEALRDKGYLPK